MLQSRNKIGALDIILIIERNVPTADFVTNEPLDSWEVVAMVRANRLMRGGKESFEADQQVDTNVESYIIRYSSDVKSMDGTYRVREKEEPEEDSFYVTLVEKRKREGMLFFVQSISLRIKIPSSLSLLATSKYNPCLASIRSIFS